MAHNCPECGSLCFCNGDIDDCCLDDPNSVNRCTHCPDDAEDMQDEDEEDDGFIEDLRRESETS